MFQAGAQRVGIVQPTDRPGMPLIEFLGKLAAIADDPQAVRMRLLGQACWAVARKLEEVVHSTGGLKECDDFDEDDAKRCVHYYYACRELFPAPSELKHLNVSLDISSVGGRRRIAGALSIPPNICVAAFVQVLTLNPKP